MFYIYAMRRHELTRHYWNRRKNEWQLELTKECHYPTRVGVNRIFMSMSNNGLILGRQFHELGFKHVEGV